MPLLTKTAGGKIRRIHMALGNRPICGGGNGGKSTQWQEDLAGPCDCAACQAIQNRKSKIANSITPPPFFTN